MATTPSAVPLPPATPETAAWQLLCEELRRDKQRLIYEVARLRAQAEQRQKEWEGALASEREWAAREAELQRDTQQAQADSQLGYERGVADARRQHERAMEEAQAEAERALADVRREMEAARREMEAELHAVREQGAREMEQRLQEEGARCAREVGEERARHGREMAAVRGQHEREVAELLASLERQRAEAGRQQALAQQQRTEMQAAHQAALGELRGQAQRQAAEGERREAALREEARALTEAAKAEREQARSEREAGARREAGLSLSVRQGAFLLQMESLALLRLRGRVDLAGALELAAERAALRLLPTKAKTLTPAAAIRHAVEADPLTQRCIAELCGRHGLSEGSVRRVAIDLHETVVAVTAALPAALASPDKAAAPPPPPGRVKLELSHGYYAKAEVVAVCALLSANHVAYNVLDGAKGDVTELYRCVKHC